MYSIIIREEDNEWSLEIEDSSYEFVKNAIIEELSCEIASMICPQNPAYNEAVGIGFTWDDMDNFDSLIENLYQESRVAVFNEKDEEVANYPLVNIFKELIEDYLASENGDIEIGSLWSAQLENYINQSEWQIALRAQDGSLLRHPIEWSRLQSVENGHYSIGGVIYQPIMWFGPEGSDIIDEWIVAQEGLSALVPEEDGMGGYGGQMRINGFEINYRTLFEGNGSWYFGACGEKGADFHKVIETCPINIVEIYSKHNGEELVADYCIKLIDKE